jgi:SOS-response transcriptional repressor LexA
MSALSKEAQTAEYSVLQLALPGRPAIGFGILLYDPATDSLYHRFRDDIHELADPEDAEVLDLLEEDLTARLRELGGRQVLEWLEDSLSNALRMTDRKRATVRDFSFTLQRLYEDHVLAVEREPARILPFVTHLPLYSLRAAAGSFGQDMETEATDWVAAPDGLRLTRDMFVAHVNGHSMEPEIPDGSLVIFRYHPAGSRQGKRVLVWRRGASEDGGEFTVKVYTSEKRFTRDGWQHSRIRLKPLNPAYPVLELDEDTEYKVLGDFVCVIPEA